MCVCVLERVSAARIQCLLQSQKSGEVPCEHLSDVFVFVLIFVCGAGHIAVGADKGILAFG